MSIDRAFLSSLERYLDDQAGDSTPAYADRVLERTSTTRQRQWWSSPERWLPVDLTLRPTPFLLRRPSRALGVLALVALLVIALIVAAVAGRGRPPALPYGLAANGSFIDSLGGDLYRLDPTTGQATPLIVDPGYDFGVTMSRDGTMLSFLRSDDDPGAAVPKLSLWVARADGTDPHQVVGPRDSMDWLDWAPDGSAFVYITHEGARTGVLRRVDVASGKDTPLGVAGVEAPAYLPPRGDRIVFRAKGIDGDFWPAIYTVRADGTDLRKETVSPGVNDYDYLEPIPSPDGHTVAFTRWQDTSPMVMLLDLDSHTIRRVRGIEGSFERGRPAFSPDGRWIAYTRVLPGRRAQEVVTAVDGSTPPVALGPTADPQADGSDIDTSAVFTPDGKSLVVRYGSDEASVTRILPVDGSPGHELTSGPFSFVDIQRLAP